MDHLHAAYGNLLTKNKNLTHAKSQAVTSLLGSKADCLPLTSCEV
jgi:hypothetical protein